MNPIVETLAAVELEAPVQFRYLAVYPLVAPSERDPGYVLLDDALARKLAHDCRLARATGQPAGSAEGRPGRSLRAGRIASILSAGRKISRYRNCCGKSSMRDTTPEFRKLVEQGYASMTPEERVRVCTEMFDTAFALVEASMPEGLDPGERRFRLCERFYGDLAARALPRR